jgi:hypothetical protein
VGRSAPEWHQEGVLSVVVFLGVSSVVVFLGVSSVVVFLRLVLLLLVSLGVEASLLSLM